MDSADQQHKQTYKQEDALVKKLGLPAPNGSYASFEWAICSDTSALDALLATGQFDLNAAQDDNGRTILHRALMNYARRPGLDGALAARLLDHGANPLLFDKNGMSTLMLAAEHQGPALLKRLKDRGVAVDAKSADGSTALMYAVAGRNADNVAALIAWGADVNVENLSGDTPLALARYEDESKIADLLKAAGAREGVSSH
jgi:ankyrin repeat protein